VLLNNFISLFDFFLPRFCNVCNIKLTTNEKYICDSCFNELEYSTQKRIQNEFSRKFLTDKIISDFASVFVFQNDSAIQSIIHSLKYDKRFQVGNFLGEQIVNNLQDKISEWNANLIIPVPLHTLRKAERGFNQSELIAKAVGKLLGIPVDTKSLKRNRFTQTQTKLTLTERKENMSEAFTLKHNKQIKNKTIILIDDVITTGATISECGKVLLNNGANKIFALSVAIAD
jgi:ComF family protein